MEQRQEMRLLLYGLVLIDLESEVGLRKGGQPRDDVVNRASDPGPAAQQVGGPRHPLQTREVAVQERILSGT